ncbi:hypothetical protein P168DRAFT_320766 [Aspergillus campestris IBT 28561]|uniref:Uncharacterized protein n=1 Tax=Aspergillus campestris (strain IBT 28561) TaxID=1392248 RepID=A0A2I1CX75_ASPC2|nr:uncharacterized protein P168DRAFT_320766 [Aspergillus campestris IBT 28561]PKY02211.1 hypothetical protein P168DRAFT_320766 [Aspergillus campestris IBT 28561]
MDPVTAERLQKLQMADLGTARREHISTADSAKFNKLRLEDIEATRLSNKVGSRAQRLAQANKDKLAGWTNVHKTIGDTEDLEDLDNLMNGQSHRAHLNASGAEAAWLELEANGSLPTNSVPIPPDRKRVQDPALVPEVKKKDHETSSQGTKASSSSVSSFPHGKNPPDFLKSRRPITGTGDFSRRISPPESFMAAARQMMQIQSIVREPSEPKTPPPTTVCEPVQSQKAVAEKSMSKALPTQVTDKNGLMQNREVQDVDKARISIAFNKEDSAKKGTQTSVDGNAFMTQNRREGSPKAKNAPEVKDASKAKDASQVMDSPKAMDAPKTMDAPKVMGASKVIDAPKAMDTPKAKNQPSTPLKKALAPRQATPTKKASIETAILLDFSATPPRGSSLQDDLASPALQDLKGLQFQDMLFDRGTLSSGQRELCNSIFAPAKKLGFQDAEKEKANTTDARGSTPVAHPSPHDTHQRDIELLCELMESASLSIEHREKLKEIEAELCKSPGSTPVKRKTSALKVPQTLLPETKRETPEELLGPRSSSLAQTPIMTSKTRPTSAPTNSPSPQSQWNIKAPPFVPRDVSNYRSPPDSSSSDSTGSLKSPPQPGQPTPVDINHIIGDHLLPGRRGSHGALSSVPMNESTSAVPDKSSVKFDMPKAPQPTRVLPLNNPFSPRPAESLKKPIEVSIPQVLPKLTEPSTPLRVPKNKAVRITDPNGNDLSESIYAPKFVGSRPIVRAPSNAVPTGAVRITSPNSNTTSQQVHAHKPAETKPKPTGRPATSGLEGSIYATSTSRRPLR